MSAARIRYNKRKYLFTPSLFFLLFLGFNLSHCSKLEPHEGEGQVPAHMIKKNCQKWGLTFEPEAEKCITPTAEECEQQGLHLNPEEGRCR